MSDRFFAAHGRRRAGFGFMAALCLALLAGCATPTVTARVTSFQRWPQGVEGQRYAFAAVPEVQARNLEYQSYQDTVRAGLGRTGLVEAAPGQPARFTVSFSYGTAPTQVLVSRPVDPFYGPGFYGPGWRRGWGWGGYWGPGWVDVPVTVYRNTLSLEIHDTSQGGAEVYRSTAYTLSNREDMVSAMPYLVRAIFDDFPGNNGAEREVEYPASQ